MKIFTVAQCNYDFNLESIVDTMWFTSFTTLAKAKHAIEEQLWNNYCDEWEDALYCAVDDELPQAPPFITWTKITATIHTGWEWPDDYEGYEFGLIEVVVE